MDIFLQNIYYFPESESSPAEGYLYKIQLSEGSVIVQLLQIQLNHFPFCKIFISENNS